MPDKIHSTNRLRDRSNETEVQMDGREETENLVFHPLCTKGLKDKLHSSLAALAIARGEALVSVKEMMNCVKRDSEHLAPKQAKEILAALDRAQTVLDAVACAPLSTTNEDITVLRETARLLQDAVMQRAN